jgi:hypothetical protein
LSIAFEKFSSIDDFIRIGDQIESGLENYRDSFFYSPCWLIPFQRVLSDEAKTIHIVGRDKKGDLKGSMHLARVKTPFLKIFRPEILALLGTRSVVSPEHLEFAINRDTRDEWYDYFNDFLRQNLKSGGLAIFDSVAEDAENISGLAEHLGSRGYLVIKQVQDQCPYLDLPETFEQLLGGYSSKKRKAIRRDLRQNEAVFNLVDHSAIGGVREALETARRLHNLSRGIKGETGSFNRAGYIEFHRRLAQSLKEEEKLYFKFLLKDETPVAFMYGFLIGSRFYDYQTGYDPDYAEQRPGFLMLAGVIKDLIYRRVGRFDFLRGYEQYKLYWTNTVRNTYRYYILPPGLKSWIYYTMLKIYRGWR